MDELGGVLAGILLLLGAPHLADGVVQGHQLAHGASQVLHSVPVGQASVQGAEGLLSLVVAPQSNGDTSGVSEPCDGERRFLKTGAFFS